MDSFSSRGRRKRRLGDLLIDAGLITREQLQEALQAQQQGDVRQKLGVTLVELGMVSEDGIADALSQQLNMERIKLSDYHIEDRVLALVDERMLRKYMLMPYEFLPENANVVRVAMSDPMDLAAIDDLSIVTGLQIEAKVTTVADVAQALDRYFGNAEAMKMADQFTQEHNERYGNRGHKEEESEEIKQAPIVRLLNQIVEQAVHRRASDIHFEPMETQLRIRFRIDGVLQEAMKHDITLFPALVARIKIVSGMDISEKRKPQDGRMSVVVDRQEYDLRVSNLPTVYGEKVVMRLTQKKALTRDKKDLGFTPEDLIKFDKILSHPHGIILVTGPTGSGKSTTLY
ncbi:MAG: Flp pilus assembly complex ATPase component TadA, partial [Lachnospiraceae bacterium]|nr:Flp pilus assembly complex ATPase component TadA [Lachnospiraceae bacterium]